jgi:hypothetical protein
MDTPVKGIELLIIEAESYANTRYELSKLKSLEVTNAIATSLLSRSIIAITITLFLLFVNVGIALLLGELLGRTYYGFFIVAGVYLLAGIVFYFFLHKWIRKPLSNFIITQVLQ